MKKHEQLSGSIDPLNLYIQAIFIPTFTQKLNSPDQFKHQAHPTISNKLQNNNLTNIIYKNDVQTCFYAIFFLYLCIEFRRK